MNMKPRIGVLTLFRHGFAAVLIKRSVSAEDQPSMLEVQDRLSNCRLSYQPGTPRHYSVPQTLPPQHDRIRRFCEVHGQYV